MTVFPVDSLAQLGHPSLLVVGDIVLDRYQFGAAHRISPEAPVPVLCAQETDSRLGGAAAVAAMLARLEATVTLVGVLGADSAGEEVERLLAAGGINMAGLRRDGSRRTTVKTRFIGRTQDRHPQQLLRVDREQSHPLSADLEEDLLAAADAALPGCAALLVSDYAKGVCTPGLCSRLVTLARAAGKPVLVDPPRLAELRHYQGANCLTPNRTEVCAATGLSANTPAEALIAGASLRERLGLQAVVITLDKDGMALAHADGRREHFSTRPRSVYDVTGAGDMVLSVLGLALAGGADYASAIPLANVAAGLAIEQLGTVTLSRAELEYGLRRDGPLTAGKFVSLDELRPLLAANRAAGQRVVFTNGCFDLMHAGHVRTLQAARACGDLLVVGLNSDSSVRRLKGPHRPLQGLASRAEVLSALACVSYVVPFDDDTPLELISKLLPQVLVKGGDYMAEAIVGRAEVEAAGGQVVVLPYYPEHSTTRLAAELAGLP